MHRGIYMSSVLFLLIQFKSPAEDFLFRFENSVPGSFLCIGGDVHLAYQVVDVLAPAHYDRVR